jgi:microsomal dipeptidase-like Zn-dependent dipeptidase/gamma-glutamyl-gamma-aminobutyrate hydrolase PuuD
MIIGLSVNYTDNKSTIAEEYYNSVIQAGGTPVIIPMTTNRQTLENIITHIDALILTGGGDIYPPLFGEEPHPTVTDYNTARDEYDITLLHAAADRQIPILGICRGHQVINIAFGGTLIQDLPSHNPNTNTNHRQTEPRNTPTHTIHIEPDTILYKTLNRTPRNENIKVNSLHHQAIKNIAPQFRAAAHSPDGAIEAIESTEGKTITGVQWHPENLAATGNKTMQNLFTHITGEAQLYNRAKTLHNKIHTIDSHTDTPLLFKYGLDIGKKNSTTTPPPAATGAQATPPPGHTSKVDIPRMQEGLIDAVFMAAYLPQGARTTAATQKATKQAITIIKQIQQQVKNNHATTALAHTVEDIKQNKKANKKTILIGIENGYAIGRDIRNIERFAQMGVLYITLSHNGHNDICDSNQGHPEHNGLSPFGRQAVLEMNRNGIIVDISHTSEKTTFDVLDTSLHPIIASHSSAKALRNHPRNLSDTLIQAIAQKGGVIQICLYDNFLVKGRNATVPDAVDHIDHIVRIAGIDHVGIGSDFDGGGGITGANAVNELINITIELMRRGYTDRDIEKIWGGNLMRVIEAVTKNR